MRRGEVQDRVEERMKKGGDEPEVDVLSVGDTSLDSSGPVGHSPTSLRVSESGQLGRRKMGREAVACTHVIFPPSPSTNMSLCRLPGTSVPRNPDPISKPLVEGIESMACARVASSLSKHGSPSYRATWQRTLIRMADGHEDEIEERLGTHSGGHVSDDAGDGSTERVVGGLGLSDVLQKRRARTSGSATAAGGKERLRDEARLTSSIFCAISLSGHLTISLSTSSLVMVLRSCMYSFVSGSSSSSRPDSVANAGRCVLPTDDTNATISIPCAILRYFSAIAPAATRPGRARQAGAPTDV